MFQHSDYASLRAFSYSLLLFRLSPFFAGIISGIVHGKGTVLTRQQARALLLVPAVPVAVFRSAAAAEQQGQAERNQQMSWMQSHTVHFRT